MKSAFYFSAACLIICASCSISKEKAFERSLSDTVALITEKDSIPEGTAYDTKSNRIFISSMYKRKIVAIEQDGNYYEFVGTAKDDLWSVFGMEVDTLRDKLWAIGTKGKPIPTEPFILDDRWQSKLYCYDLKGGKLVGIFDVNPKVTDEFGFNDLSFSKNGDVYMTESNNSKIYVLKYGSVEIEEFLKPEGLTFLNRITLSPDNKSLFVSSTEGLLKVNLSTKDYKVLKYEFTTTPQPIDGLAFYNNSLIGHQSFVVTRFYLNESLDTILRHEIIDDRFLNSSTAGEVGKDGWYYYIANSQIRSGVDYKNKRIKPLDSLQPVIIKRKRID
jgi:sugar lactone lactonase YvrE